MPRRGHLAVWVAAAAIGGLAAIVVFAMRPMTSEAPGATPEPVAPAPPSPVPRRPPQSYFAAPGGAPTADGSVGQPLDLVTALSSKGPLAQGDTLWLRGGTYRGSFASEVSGSPEAAVHVKAFPGERVVLDGAGSLRATLEILGSDAWFWGLEIANSDPSRTFDTPSDGNTRRATGVAVLAPRVRLISLVVHDAFTGVALSERADEVSLYGCLIYENGIREPQGGIGHGILLSTTGRVQLVDVVTFNNQGRGINASAGTGAGTLVIDGLVSFNNGQSGGDTAFKLENLFVEGSGSEVRVTNSHLYHAPGTTGQNVRLENRPGQPGALTLGHSVLVGGSSSLSAAHWRQAEITSNLFYLLNAPNPAVDQTIAHAQTPPAPAAYVWNANTYIDETARGYPFIFNQATNAYGGGNLSYHEWQQASRFDADSQYGRGRPTDTDVFVRRDAHESGRGLVVIYNWDSAPSVFVRLDALGLESGARVDVLDVSSPFGRLVVAGADASEPIAVPMLPSTDRGSATSLTIQPRHTKPAFAAFIVRPAKAGQRARTTQ